MSRASNSQPTATPPRTGREVHLVARPAGPARVEDFAVVSRPVAEPGPGEVLVRNLFMSVDPALRLRLGATGPTGYFPPFELGAPLTGLAVGEVLASNAAGFAAGDMVRHGDGWREFAVVSAAPRPAIEASFTLRHIDTELGPPEAFLGPLGNGGLTAYAGLVEAAQLRTGDVVWVSGAAGSVGSLAVQIAKLRGHRTIGSAGSDEKVAFLLDELGIDAAFNYKDGSVAELLARAAPDGIDVYFDNVGGAHLEAALEAIRHRGRIALCGAVGEYDAEPQVGVRNLFLATWKDVSLAGFRTSSHLALADKVARELSIWLRQGRLQFSSTVVDGICGAPAAFIAMMAGQTKGKTLVRLT